MNKERFSTYLKHPETMNEQSVSVLQDLVSKYPYFTAGRILLLRNLHTSNDSDYDKELPLTSIYAGNRGLLYNYIFGHKQTPVQQDTLPVEPKDNEPAVETQSELDTISTPELGPETFEKPNPIDTSQKTSEHKNVSLTDNTFYSFSQWLDIMSRKQDEAQEEVPQKSKPKSKSWDLIDNFIQESPKISKPTQESVTNQTRTNLASQSSEHHEEFMTETLAKIYIKQKHYKKAIQIFKKLSLKYPEKSIYFAGQIKVVEQLLNNEN